MGEELGEHKGKKYYFEKVKANACKVKRNLCYLIRKNVQLVIAI